MLVNIGQVKDETLLKGVQFWSFLSLKMQNKKCLRLK